MEALGTRPVLCGLKGDYSRQTNSGQTNNVGINHINFNLSRLYNYNINYSKRFRQ